MSIEKGSKWVKDGEVVEVKKVEEMTHQGFFYPVVWFNSTQHYAHILTERDFFEQYKPYEPVYEYQYAVNSSRGVIEINSEYRTDSEAKFFYTGLPFQRLDFTKRERK